jgi:hypothetical protein
MEDSKKSQISNPATGDMIDELSVSEQIEITDHLNLSKNVQKAYGTKKNNKKKESFGVNLTFESPSTIAKLFS